MVFRKRAGNRIKKRGWTATANLGPFGRYSVSTHKRSLQSKVVNIVRRNLETVDHNSISDGTNTFAPTHNTIYTWNPMNTVTQGTAQSNRLEDEVHLDAVKIRMFQNGPTSLNTVTYRLMAVKSSISYTNSTFYSGFGTSDLFMAGTGTTYTTTGIIDPKKVTLLWDKEWTMTPYASSQALAKIITETVKFNQKFIFKPGTQVAKDKNIYFVFISSIIGGTTGTTATGNVYCSSDLIFKNCK